MSVGMKSYVRELVARLPAAAPDFAFIAVANAELPGSMERVRIPDNVAANASLGEQFGLPRIMQRTGAGLAHFMSVYAPRRSLLPYVYTIHDLIHRRFPHYFSWKIPPYYALVVGPAARRARAVITDAQATIADLRDFLGVRPERARAVPLGAAEKFTLTHEERAERAQRARARIALSKPFFLYAGNHRPHKNLATLARAWQRVQEPCELVITEAGSLGFAPDRFAKANGRIVLPGHVEEEDLLDLYAACSGVVQPSLYEGYGLSVLEGMNAGAPVVVAQTPALLEVAGDAALTFPPLDAEALARHLTVLLRDSDLAQALREKGHERAAHYSWNETARRTADVYREVLA